MKSFSFEDRLENLKRLENEKFDLFVIGGGINGAGVARDAALRGMKVGLVEAADFASGTSSRSSKLIHGGIRYLENFEFKLVFEALSERHHLFEMAPHLVHPLRFMIPIYQQSRVGMFKMGLGMWAYDALSLFQAPKLHERLNAAETRARLPALQAQDLLGSFVYSDAYMDDDRLVIETLRSANEAGAVCANYVKATGASFDPQGKVTAVTCEDQLTGHRFTVQARHFVSSVGPWTDELGQEFFDKWKKILRPTKGVHLTFEKKRLPLENAVVMGAETRIVFGIPRHEMVIVGTTDTDFSGDPKDVVATPEDVRYLLSVVEKYFPGAQITAQDILATYAGVRPLVHDGSANEGKTSREHTIFTDTHGVTFVAGGKYTTYRLMSEQIVKECLRHFPIEDRVRFNRGSSKNPINPLITSESRRWDHQLISELKLTKSLSLPEAQLLLDRHGAEVREIWRNFGARSYWELEARQALEHTMCVHLVDFYARRAPLFLAEKDHGAAQLPLIISIFAQVLGWNREQIEAEKDLLAKHMASELAWRQKIV